MHYNFYFDETFHDRKISIKSTGVVNVFTTDKNDNYIGVFLGYTNTKNSSVMKKFHKLENKFIKIYGLDVEFKSTVINKKNFTYGIHSFNKNAFDFYLDLFDVLEGISPIIHVNVLNKIEWLIRNIFSIEAINRMSVISDSFYYSLTKFLITYHTTELIQALYNSSEINDGNLFKEELLNHLDKVINALRGIERKQREIPALKSLYQIIKSYNFNNTIKNKYDFIYFQNFEGLSLLLEELKISVQKVNITIDREESTYQAALNYKFNDVKQTKSEHSIQIRISDHLCGFIGRMMFSLSKDESIKEDVIKDINSLDDCDLAHKHLLSPDWFDLEEKHFVLYKKIYKVLVLKQEAYWATMSWSFSDQVSMFYTLLRYFAGFDSFKDYKKYKPEEHSEYYNYNCCKELERHFNSFTNQ